jgi:metal-dependent amidase/aminoacylase/carboxypeptidase family protein
VPVAPLGYLWCKEGPVMSESSKITIKIIGTGGHGSDP